jgi:hypothetical protein
MNTVVSIFLSLGVMLIPWMFNARTSTSGELIFLALALVLLYLTNLYNLIGNQQRRKELMLSSSSGILSIAVGLLLWLQA